jgi:transcription elongation factor GreA
MNHLDRPVYLTEKGKAELAEELEYLQNVKRLETIECLQEATRGGEWTDNTEHMLIEEELAFIDGRIKEIKHMLDQAQIIGPGQEDNLVELGETVIIQNSEGELEEYTIVGAAEADPGRGFISNEAPLGRALLNHKIGDDVEVKAPIGILNYRIIDIKQPL